MIRECARSYILLSKLLFDAGAWQVWGKNETYIFCTPPPCSNNVFATLL